MGPKPPQSPGAQLLVGLRLKPSEKLGLGKELQKLNSFAYLTANTACPECVNGTSLVSGRYLVISLSRWTRLLT